MPNHTARREVEDSERSRVNRINMKKTGPFRAASDARINHPSNRQWNERPSEIDLSYLPVPLLNVVNHAYRM